MENAAQIESDCPKSAAPFGGVYVKKELPAMFNFDGQKAVFWLRCSSNADGAVEVARPGAESAYRLESPALMNMRLEGIKLGVKKVADRERLALYLRLNPTDGGESRTLALNADTGYALALVNALIDPQTDLGAPMTLRATIGKNGKSRYINIIQNGKLVFTASRPPMKTEVKVGSTVVWDNSEQMAFVEIHVKELAEKLERMKRPSME